MSFAEPLWFLLLIAIPLVIVLQIFIWKRRGKAWKQLIAQRLRKRLSHPRSATKYFVGLALAMLGLLLLVTSLAMPEAGDEWIETRNEGRNLLLCMDISQSMLTEDVGSGSRLDAAKAAALEIADRIIVLNEGVVVGTHENNNIDLNTLIAQASGTVSAPSQASHP